MSELSIDREYDQTSRHLHGDESCSVCREFAEGRSGVSPAILEYQLVEKDREIRNLEMKLDLASARIIAFEQLVRRLSAHLDDLAKLAGVTRPTNVRGL